MDQVFEGTPKAQIRLDGRKAIRSDVSNDWGSILGEGVKQCGGNGDLAYVDEISVEVTGGVTPLGHPPRTIQSGSLAFFATWSKPRV